MDLTLNYWNYSPIGSAWNVSWVMVGTGTVVPEPSMLALIVPAMLLAARQRR